MTSLLHCLLHVIVAEEYYVSSGFVGFLFGDLDFYDLKIKIIHKGGGRGREGGGTRIAYQCWPERIICVFYPYHVTRLQFTNCKNISHITLGFGGGGGGGHKDTKYGEMCFHIESSLLLSVSTSFVALRLSEGNSLSSSEEEESSESSR